MAHLLNTQLELFLSILSGLCIYLLHSTSVCIMWVTKWQGHAGYIYKMTLTCCLESLDDHSVVINLAIDAKSIGVMFLDFQTSHNC